MYCREVRDSCEQRLIWYHESWGLKPKDLGTAAEKIQIGAMIASKTGLNISLRPARPVRWPS
jgi:hypothetical protein